MGNRQPGDWWASPWEILLDLSHSVYSADCQTLLKYDLEEIVLGNTIGGSIKPGIIIGILSFFIAIGVSLGSEFFLGKITSLWLSFLLLLIIILGGIVFDIIGVAAAAAGETSFHAMAARRAVGARQAIWIVRNAPQVSNFCNDVVGDIASAVAGAMGATIAIRLALWAPGEYAVFWGVFVTGLVSGLTVGIKRMGKTLGIHSADKIVGMVGLFLGEIEKWTGIDLFDFKSRKREKVKV